MTGPELFEIWAPADSVWSPWVAPALFAQIIYSSVADHVHMISHPPAWVSFVGPSHDAVILDLPGPNAVRIALQLTKCGFRPVPMINAAPGPTGLHLDLPQLPPQTHSHSIVTLEMTSLIREICLGTEFVRKLQLSPNAPPVFILDSRRARGTHPVEREMFDNRWMVFPQDFPSARFLIGQGIKRVALVQTERSQPLEDLSHVLLRWQEAGLEILSCGNQDTAAPAKVNVTKPSRFKLSWYRALAAIGFRRNSAGGFGSFIPESSSSG